MSMFKVITLVMCIIVAVACPPLAIPAIALFVFIVDRFRKRVNEAKRVRDVFIEHVADQERYKALRSL